MAVIVDDDLIIDPSMIEEPDESEDEENTESGDEFGFDDKKLTIEGESVVDDEEFDEDREDVYEPYEDDPTLLDEDDDL